MMCFLQFSDAVLQGREVAFHTIPKVSVKIVVNYCELLCTIILVYV